MAAIKIKSDKLPDVLVREIRRKLSSNVMASILVDQAKTRIRKSGDSEVTYPDLWANKSGIGIRKGGIPLRDTSNLMNRLFTIVRTRGNTIQWKLMDGAGYGVKHQEGFINKGPIAIALSAKAKRLIPSESPHDIAALDSMKLEKAPNAEAARNPRKGSIKYDYYILEGDQKVPARPIANMPPENIKGIRRLIKRTIKG